MAKVTVRMFATVREAAGTDTVNLEAESVAEALERVSQRFGRSVKRLLDGLASDPESIVVLINGKNPGHSRALAQRLSDGDEIALFPPVSGG